MATPLTRIWVLYDPTCGFCVRCANWLHGQRTFLPLLCLPLDSEQITRRFPGLLAHDKEELTVVDSSGGVYRGAKGWLMALWALQEYRAWSLRLARPGLLPLARNAFELVSSNRHAISRLLRLRGEREIATALSETLGPTDRPRCSDAECRVPHAAVKKAACPTCTGMLPADAKRCPWCGVWLKPAGGHAQAT